MAGKKRAKARETFTRYDTADYLDIARARGMAELAAKTGLTREGLYKALSKDGNPSFATVMKVMRALGLMLEPRVAA